MGTALWDLTKDKLTVRDLSRHGTTSMTEKYIHGIDPRLEEAQNKLVNAIIPCASVVSPNAQDVEDPGSGRIAQALSAVTRRHLRPGYQPSLAVRFGRDVA